MSNPLVVVPFISSTLEDEQPIPLTDLVRSGEASRLRRRGAISTHRLNRSASYVSLDVPNVSDPQRTRPQPAQPSAPPQPWTDGGSTQVYAPLSEMVTDDDLDGQGFGPYAIYCGYEDLSYDSTDDSDDYDSWCSPFPTAHSPSPKPIQRFRQSSGCGALIHTNGFPRKSDGTWHAKGKASSVVIPMDKMYFERGGQPRQFACGCRWHGVGCSQWYDKFPFYFFVFNPYRRHSFLLFSGNALGNIYLPCQQATGTSSTAVSRDSRPRSSFPPTSTSEHHVYHFFFDAVTSSPFYDFPKCCPSDSRFPALAPPPLQRRQSSSSSITAQGIAPAQVAASATAPNASTVIDTIVGRDVAGERPDEPLRWGDIPIPSDENDYTYGYALQQEQGEPGAELDRDGVPLLVEPGSPDKPSSEATLWPAR